MAATSGDGERRFFAEQPEHFATYSKQRGSDTFVPGADVISAAGTTSACVHESLFPSVQGPWGRTKVDLEITTEDGKSEGGWCGFGCVLESDAEAAFRAGAWDNRQHLYYADKGSSWHSNGGSGAANLSGEKLKFIQATEGMDIVSSASFEITNDPVKVGPHRLLLCILSPLSCFLMHYFCFQLSLELDYSGQIMDCGEDAEGTPLGLLSITRGGTRYVMSADVEPNCTLFVAVSGSRIAIADAELGGGFMTKSARKH
jgi:hypothetical protein